MKGLEWASLNFGVKKLISIVWNIAIQIQGDYNAKTHMWEHTTMKLYSHSGTIAKDLSGKVSEPGFSDTFTIKAKKSYHVIVIKHKLYQHGSWRGGRYGYQQVPMLSGYVEFKLIKVYSSEFAATITVLKPAGTFGFDYHGKAKSVTTGSVTLNLLPTMVSGALNNGGNNYFIPQWGSTANPPAYFSVDDPGLEGGKSFPLWPFGVNTRFFTVIEWRPDDVLPPGK